MNTLFTLNYPLHSILWARESRLIKEILLILGGVILLALSAQCVIPLKPVPLTFQSATVVLLGMIYGARLGFLTLLTYLIVGGMGLPLFAELSSGWTPFTGATGGYLVGFLPAALLGGFLTQQGFGRNIFSAFVATLLSASVIFMLGVLVLSHFVGFKNAILLGVTPFILTEPLKLLAVAFIVPSFWKKQ
ncbi:MAG: hypothetical protein ACD_60C00035G0003 [uncultured bacterium]|nr:MAG: hypothetical protein ACD_60C00035G0003 [uncultured bacterium]